MQTYLRPASESLDRRVLVLGGMGGIGKTQLAIAYAKRYREIYSSIFWLNAASETTLKSSFVTLAKRTIPAGTTNAPVSDTDQLRTLILNWFSELDNKGWLLIFDNYDNPDQYQISSYYPYVSHGSIIITTRLPDQVGVDPLVLRSFNNVNEGLRILQTRSRRGNVKDGRC